MLTAPDFVRKLIVNLFEIGEDTTIYTLLDQSHSMRHKWLHARQMAADRLYPLLATSRGRAKALPFLQTQEVTDRVCDLKGDIELECIEGGRRERVTVTPREARRFEDAVVQWNTSLNDACRQRGIGLISTTTEVEFENIIQSIFRRGGLVA